jgi:glycosyltransferase involved in cell wall biosynthesis
MIWNLEEHVFQHEAVLEELCREFLPEALIGATIYGAAAAARLPFDLPRWVDMHGHPMAEAQAKAALDGRDDVLPYFWEMVRQALEHADRISVSSRFQRYATIGELGALGRLNHRNAGYELVELVPSALDPRRLAPTTRPRLRGVRFDPAAFVVLWSGGFNVWADGDTLFDALELAMARVPGLVFVSTGGAILGHDETTYERFRARVAGSKFARRFHLLGWLPRSEAEQVPFEADLGIILDRFLYEGVLGHRTRILEWMRYGLPSICSDLGEVGALVEEHQLGWATPVGNAELVAQLLVRLADDRASVREHGARAKAYAESHLSYQATTVAVQRWVERPGFAPDHQPASD